MITRFTTLSMKQMAKAYKGVKSQPKKKPKLGFEMPKKTGWRKSAFGKTFPNYSRYDLALDAALLSGGALVYSSLSKKKKKKKKET
jgi:hypothetical protein|tara:strand:+ start:705 stop:962 length:258 start_codon:yes stop_codon:yes gene_type:complete